MLKEIEKDFNEICDEIGVYFTEAELKATLNAFLIPLFLITLSNNILWGINWVLLITVIYKSVQKEKVENAELFFKFLQVEAIILFIFGITIVT